MSVETASQTTADLAKAPGVFRTAVKLAGRNWSAGSLTFILPDGESLRLQGEAPGPDARLLVRDYRFIRRALVSGDIGFAEGYMAGEWDTPDLAALLGVLAINFDVLRGLTRGNPVARAFHAVNHALRRNSRRGSKRNIHAHYDLGNAFYARWLDPTMTYSSARFASPDQPLAEAQRNKYATLARGIDLKPDHTVLEIGCGWGGFAEYAAKEVGARVTGVAGRKTYARADGHLEAIDPADTILDYARLNNVDHIIMGDLAPSLKDKRVIDLVDYLTVNHPFADAADTNTNAIAVDQAYLASQKPTGVYPMMYYPHNVHFFWSAASMEGRSADAIRAFHAEHSDIILKPLDGMGGMGIFRVKADGLNLGSITETLNRDGAQTVMVQKFLPAISEGDKRVLVIGGKPAPFCLARIPRLLVSFRFSCLEEAQRYLFMKRFDLHMQRGGG